jgi:putative phage-type endonuclease
MKREDFLNARRAGIGGSDVGAILGLSKFSSPVDVWLSKTGRKPVDYESTLPQRFGMFGEAFVAQEYTAKTGLDVVRYNKQLVHSEHSFILGNVDRLVIPAGKSIAHHMGQIRTDRGMEAKCVSAYAGGEWGDDESDDVPPFYLAQCAWYRILTGCTYWDLAALIGNHRFEVYQFATDRDLEQMLVAVAVEFWNKHVLADVPPAPRSAEDVAALFPKSEEGRKAIADAELAKRVEAIRARKDAIKSLESALEDDMVAVKGHMQVAEALTLVTETGKVLATWKNNKDGKKTDYEAAFGEVMNSIMVSDGSEYAKNLHLELMAKYTKTTPGPRVFLLKK